LIEDYEALQKFDAETARGGHVLGQADKSPFLRISVNNHDADDIPMPCSLNHEDYADFSSMALEPSAANDGLGEFWRGTCLSNSDTCTVVLVKRHVMQSLTYP
jgi:hypothetical protein